MSLGNDTKHIIYYLCYKLTLSDRHLFNFEQYRRFGRWQFFKRFTSALRWQRNYILNIFVFHNISDTLLSRIAVDRRKSFCVSVNVYNFHFFVNLFFGCTILYYYDVCTRRMCSVHIFYDYYYIKTQGSGCKILHGLNWFLIKLLVSFCSKNYLVSLWRKL